MIVAIEGMDGSGKTSISKAVASKVGFQYVEKALKQYLNMSEEEYENICQKIYLLDDDLKAMFFSLGNLLAVKNRNQNIILDKHILSTYFWNKTEGNKDLFDVLIDMGIFPDITIILYSSIENRVRHNKFRNTEDKDLHDEKKLSFGYDKMIEFAEQKQMPYIFLNGDELSFDEIVNKIIIIIGDFQKLSKEEIYTYCININNQELKKNDYIRKLCFRGEFRNEK